MHLRRPAFALVLVSIFSTVLPVHAADRRTFIDAEAALRARFGAPFDRIAPGLLREAIVELAESLPVGGAIALPESAPCGTLDFRRVADDVQITGGHEGTVILGGGQRGVQLLFSQLDQRIEPGRARPTRALRPVQVVAVDFKDFRLLDPKAAPASELLAMFCDGTIKIDHDVDHCAWIAGANAFGKKTVTASARVDHSLFLWFGINWPFADYNGHLDPKNAGKDWLDNSQMWFDCKGGGQGTRLYLMVETNYGNPGPGVVLQNCKGMSLYHGSTERASSQGPGIYWLKDCEDVRLGLRRTFSATREGARNGAPSHDLTVEGGRGNILHNIEFFGNAQQESLVNSSPDLQLWSVSFDFETKGLEGDQILRFCTSPDLNRPEGKDLATLKARLPKLIDDKLKYRHMEATDENKKRLEESFLSGRDGWYPLNAKRETTFQYGPDDLTRGLEKLSKDHKLPPPPSMPATYAPRLTRRIEFTQQPGFGKALLDAGADPTGQKPSDDAFARLMFGMTRDQLQEVLEQTYQAEKDFRAAEAKKDEGAIKAARAKLEEALEKLQPSEVGDKGKKTRVKRPRLEVPPGTFLLNRPLVLVGGWSTMFGAGPDKTVFKAGGDFKVIEQHEPGSLANFTVEGGKVGLAFTGSDHEKGFSPTLHSYIAGQNFYKITFRNQTFAGIHVGNDDPELMGGSEHDQNKYVDLVFENTGDYGIFMNQNMLDKWLCLHNEFRGQKKAGISIKFNNLIHGAVIGCKFENINGPGLDFMGGNPEIRFRTHQVMVDQCEFLECGNEKSPAVDQGAGVCMSFTRCKIVTKDKKVQTGYRGGAAIYEDVTVDVNPVDGGPVMVLRGARQNQTGRPNGHTLRNIRANGSLGFVNDANAYNDVFKKTCAERKIDPNLNWDCNPAAHELAPPNGWVHPFVLYDCRFGAKAYDYTLLNVSTDQGKALQEIDLARLAR